MMAKIVGKLFFAGVMIFLLVGLAATKLYAKTGDSSIALRVTDRHGRALAQVYANEPFKIQASVEGDGQQSRSPQIKGIEQLQIQSYGDQTTIINGATTRSYIYTVKAPEPGTYELGPALLEKNGARIVSEKKIIEVVERSGAEQNSSTQTAFLAWSVEPERVVVGQKVMAYLRFYYQDDSLLIDQLEQPVFTGFDTQVVGEPTAGMTKIDDVSYRYAQWTWELYPRETGELTIPALRARGVVERARDFWSFFGQRETVMLQAEAISLHVDPLPAYDGTVNAVGTFTNFIAEIDRAVVQEGEGIVLKFTLQGDGNLAVLSLPPLQMPDAFTWYDSKEYVEGDIKVFEFIVQGSGEGTLEIPAQTFTYFDVVDRHFKQLHTEPLMVTITPGLNKTSFDTTSIDTSDVAKAMTDKQDGRESADELQQPPDDLMPLDTTGVWYPVTERAIPLFWLIVAMLLPLSAWVISTYQRWQQLRYRTGSVALAYRSAFSIARARFEKLRREQKATDLYDVFRNLCAARLRIAPALIQQHTLAEDVGLLVEEAQEWTTFCTQLAEIAFSGEQPADVDELFAQAGTWLMRLEEVL